MYAEQVGWKRQAGGVSGETRRWYRRTQKIRKAAAAPPTRRVGGAAVTRPV